MATDFSVHFDPSGHFSDPSTAVRDLEVLNAAGFTARLTPEQPRGPYRRYTTAAPLEVVKTLPGFIPGSESVTADPEAMRPGATAVIERAYDLAESYTKGFDLAVLVGSASSLPSVELLALALVLAGERFSSLETTFMCCWCRGAARTPAEHLALSALTFDQVREHGPRCDHNPLTQAVRAYFAALDAHATKAGWTSVIANVAAAEQRLRRFAEVGS